MDACDVLWVVGAGLLDDEADDAVVRTVDEDALGSVWDEIIDEIEDVLSPPFAVAELRASADVSLPSNTLSTSCALTIVVRASKESNIREACARASMILKGFVTRATKFWYCFE